MAEQTVDYYHHPSTAKNTAPILRSTEIAGLVPELAAMTPAERLAYVPELATNPALTREFVDASLVPVSPQQPRPIITIYDANRLEISRSASCGSHGRSYNSRERYLLNVLFLRRNEPPISFQELEQLERDILMEVNLNYRFSPYYRRQLSPTAKVLGKLRYKMGAYCFVGDADSIGLAPDVEIIDKRPIPINQAAIEIGAEAVHQAATPPPETAPEIEVPFAPEYQNFGDARYLRKRQRVIGNIVATYASHPAVERALRSLRAPGETPYFENLLHQYIAEAFAYSHVPSDDTALNEHFRTIEQAVWLAAQQEKGLQVLDAQMEAANIKAAIAHQTIHLATLHKNYQVAKKLQQSDLGAVNLLDLIQEADLGLIKSISRYDYTRNIPFTGYAHAYTEKSVRDALRSAQALRISQYQDLNNQKVQGVLLAQPTATPEVIAQKTGLSIERIKRTLANTAYVAFSLNEVAPEVIDPPQPPVTREITPEQERQRELLLHIMQEGYLRQSEKLALSLRWGVYLEELSGLTLGPDQRSYSQIFDDAVYADHELTAQEIATLCGLQKKTFDNYLHNGKAKMLKIAFEARQNFDSSST